MILGVPGGHGIISRYIEGRIDDEKEEHDRKIKRVYKAMRQKFHFMDKNTLKKLLFECPSSILLEYRICTILEYGYATTAIRYCNQLVEWIWVRNCLLSNATYEEFGTTYNILCYQAVNGSSKYFGGNIASSGLSPHFASDDCKNELNFQYSSTYNQKTNSLTKEKENFNIFYTLFDKKRAMNPYFVHGYASVSIVMSSIVLEAEDLSCVALSLCPYVLISLDGKPCLRTCIFPLSRYVVNEDLVKKIIIPINLDAQMEVYTPWSKLSIEIYDKDRHLPSMPDLSRLLLRFDIHIWTLKPFCDNRFEQHDTFNANIYEFTREDDVGMIKGKPRRYKTAFVTMPNDDVADRLITIHAYTKCILGKITNPTIPQMAIFKIREFFSASLTPELNGSGKRRTKQRQDLHHCSTNYNVVRDIHRSATQLMDMTPKSDISIAGNVYYWGSPTGARGGSSPAEQNPKTDIVDALDQINHMLRFISIVKETWRVSERRIYHRIACICLIYGILRSNYLWIIIFIIYLLVEGLEFLAKSACIYMRTIHGTRVDTGIEEPKNKHVFFRGEFETIDNQRSALRTVLKAAVTVKNEKRLLGIKRVISTIVSTIEQFGVYSSKMIIINDADQDDDNEDTMLVTIFKAAKMRNHIVVFKYIVYFCLIWIAACLPSVILDSTKYFLDYLILALVSLKLIFNLSIIAIIVHSTRLVRLPFNFKKLLSARRSHRNVRSSPE